MEIQYLCPLCKKALSVGEDIILIGKNSRGGTGIVLLHTEIGNYASKFTEDFRIKEGEVVDFCCPLCNQSLTYNFKAGFANLIRVEGNEEHVIIFSKKYGEKLTLKDEGEKIMKYSDIAKKFTDPEWFLE